MNVIVLHIKDKVVPTAATIEAIPVLRAMLKRSGVEYGEIVDIIEDGDACPIHVRFGNEWFFFDSWELKKITK